MYWEDWNSIRILLWRRYCLFFSFYSGLIEFKYYFSLYIYTLTTPSAQHGVPQTLASSLFSFHTFQLLDSFYFYIDDTKIYIIAGLLLFVNTCSSSSSYNKSCVGPSSNYLKIIHDKNKILLIDSRVVPWCKAFLNLGEWLLITYGDYVKNLGITYVRSITIHLLRGMPTLLKQSTRSSLLNTFQEPILIQLFHVTSSNQLSESFTHHSIPPYCPSAHTPPPFSRFISIHYGRN